MNRSVVVFDIDRTLVKHDLHSLIVDSWARNGAHRAFCRWAFSRIRQLIPTSYLRRKTEYLLVEFIDEEFIRTEVTRLVADNRATNLALVRRLRRYQRASVDVVLITASPGKTAKVFSSCLNTEVMSSRMRWGYLTYDLLGRKGQIYEELERANRLIRTIYSDSTLDFWFRARKNILVQQTGLRLIRE